MNLSDDHKKIIDFWDSALKLSDEDKSEARGYSADDWQAMAPSEKLLKAAASLGACEKVLDYGCGNAWAGIIAARSGCKAVTAVDPAPGAADTAKLYAEVFGAKDRMEILCAGGEWLAKVPSETYDGFICSNVLDVVLPETAEGILREVSRILKKGAPVIIGMNYYVSPEAAAAKGIELQNGNLLHVDGVLRMVSRSDEEWTQIFGKSFKVECLEHFAWPGEPEERRRLFYLRNGLE